MRCERCGHDFAAGLSQCPHCGTDIHYNGKTVFFGNYIFIGRCSCHQCRNSKKFLSVFDIIGICSAVSYGKGYGLFAV